MTKPRVLKVSLFLSGWTLLGVISAGQWYVNSLASGMAFSWSQVLASSLLAWYTWAILSPLIFWLGERDTLGRKPWWRSLLIHLPASVFFSLRQLTI